MCIRDSIYTRNTSSKNVCVLRRMCFSSVSSRKFFFSASELAFTSFISFSSFSNVDWTKRSKHIIFHLILQSLKCWLNKRKRTYFPSSHSPASQTKQTYSPSSHATKRSKQICLHLTLQLLIHPPNKENISFFISFNKNKANIAFFISLSICSNDDYTNKKVNILPGPKNKTGVETSAHTSDHRH